MGDLGAVGRIEFWEYPQEAMRWRMQAAGGRTLEARWDPESMILTEVEVGRGGQPEWETACHYPDGEGVERVTAIQASARYRRVEGPFDGGFHARALAVLGETGRSTTRKPSSGVDRAATGTQSRFPARRTKAGPFDRYPYSFRLLGGVEVVGRMVHQILSGKHLQHWADEHGFTKDIVRTAFVAATGVTFERCRGVGVNGWHIPPQSRVIGRQNWAKRKPIYEALARGEMPHMTRALAWREEVAV